MQAGDTLRARVSNTRAKKLQATCTWRAERLHLVSRKGAEKLQNVFYNWNSGPPRDATFLDTGLAKKSIVSRGSSTQRCKIITHKSHHQGP